MNTKKKAVISGLAGAALLLGTGATFALWQDSTTLSTGADGITINVGHLNLDALAFEYEEGLTDLLWRPGHKASATIDLNEETFVNMAGTGIEALLKLEVFENDAVTINYDGTHFVIEGVSGYWTLTPSFTGGTLADLIGDGVLLTVDEDGVVRAGDTDFNEEFSLGFELAFLSRAPRGVDLNGEFTDRIGNYYGPQEAGHSFELFDDVNGIIGNFTLTQVVS